MADVLGGNIPQLQQLETQLRQRSDEVATLKNQLTQMIGGTWWKGPAADRFLNEWNGQYSTSLRNLEEMLRSLSVEVQRRREALIQVSQ